MFILACIALGLCLILAVGQFIVVLSFVRGFQSERKVDTHSSFAPRAAVILALRGPDPFLSDCLQGLLAQDYEDYKIFVVVDHEKDPVLQQLKAIQAKDQTGRIEINILQSRHSTCSLKCSSLIQAVEQLDETFEAAAFLDGDVIPHETWLSELIAPLSDESVGVTTGNRWYDPSGQGWGSWIRYCWNVGAVVQVWLNKITWAGSMAMRLSNIAEVKLLEAWKCALSVDATVHRQMRQHEKQVQFVSSVIMLNRENISTRKFISWVQRQLIAAKSCGAGWTLVGLHAFNLAFTQAFSLIMFSLGLIYESPLIVLLTGTGLVLYWGSAFLSIFLIEKVIRKTLANHGEQIQWTGWQAAAQALIAMLLTQAVYPFALGSALFKRAISWRGVEYQIHGNSQVELVTYEPFTNATVTSESVI